MCRLVKWRSRLSDYAALGRSSRRQRAVRYVVTAAACGISDVPPERNTAGFRIPSYARLAKANSRSTHRVTTGARFTVSRTTPCIGETRGGFTSSAGDQELLPLGVGQ